MKFASGLKNRERGSERGGLFLVLKRSALEISDYVRSSALQELDFVGNGTAFVDRGCGFGFAICVCGRWGVGDRVGG